MESWSDGDVIPSETEEEVFEQDGVYEEIIAVDSHSTSETKHSLFSKIE